MSARHATPHTHPSPHHTHSGKKKSTFVFVKKNTKKSYFFLWRGVDIHVSQLALQSGDVHFIIPRQNLSPDGVLSQKLKLKMNK